LEHTFVVEGLRKHIKRYTSNVEIIDTQGPDVVFDCKGEKYAIEVETARFLKEKIGRLKEKFRLLKEQCGSRWFIVPTLSKYSYFFSKFGVVITRKNVLNHIDVLFTGQKPSNSDRLRGCEIKQKSDLRPKMALFSKQGLRSVQNQTTEV
jgi:hypothetical protein